MLGALSRIRIDERRETFGATLTAFVVLAAHALLETARDALFLANLPAARLPWVYLALAVVGVTLAVASSRAAARFDTRRSVMFAQVVAGLGTICFWGLAKLPNDWVYYGLYIWTGVASMSVLVRFWLHLGERFTTTQAKRLFPMIGAGSVGGVLVGYAVADAIARRSGAESLLWVSAASFVLSGAGPLLFGRSCPQQSGGHERGASASRPGVWESISTGVRHPYVRRVALILLLSSLTVTLVDFAFKSVVARSVPPGDLGSFFARIYFLFNVLSLTVLLGGAVPLVRSSGVTGALALLPAALIVGGLGLTVQAGLLVVLLLKGADGILRWSTHKTAAELLYVPMPGALRNMVRTVIDVVMHRGGQAIASLLIIAGLALTDDTRLLGPLVVASAGLWCYVALTSRAVYLNLFRNALSEGAVQTRLDFPELDVGSLETLITALNADDDNKVVAAMDLLEQKGKAQVVPALILYHPSPGVVVRALDLFAEAKRTDFLAIVPRILDHEYAEVRAAALRAMSAVRPDPDALRHGLEHHCPVVNVTALVGLTVGGWKPVAEAVPELLRHVEKDSALARPMIARAIRYRPMAEFAPVLTRLAQAPELETRREAVLAMRAARDGCFIPTLIDLLRERPLREDVRRTLLDLGDPALDWLEERLADLSTPFAVRVHLPRTISRFQGQRAAEILVRHLLSEPRGMVRYKVLRGLGRLVANDPLLSLDEATLDEVLRRTVTSCFRALHWSLMLERGAAERSDRRTSSWELLRQLLRDKERHSIERLFRTLGLRFRGEDVGRIYNGLMSSRPSTRSSSRELLESALPSRLGGAILGLTDDVSADARLEAGSAFYEPGDLDYEKLLAVLAAEPSRALQSIAAYHAAEISVNVAPGPETIEAGESDPLAHLDTQAVVMLRDGLALRGGGSRET